MHLKIRLFCLMMALTLFLSSCGGNHTATDQTKITTTTIATTTATTTDDLHHTSSSTTDTTTLSSIHEDISTTVTTTATITTTTTITTSAGATATTTRPSQTTTAETFITFTATVRDEHKQPISGVTVFLYAGTDTNSATTDKSGVARIRSVPSSSYRVVLDNLPAGYEADAEYRFTTNKVNITIRKKAVQNEADHSGAQYDVGKTMTNFTLTDTDGKSYRLSDLLKEKKLIILDFWFATCEPCKKEFPYFESAIKTYGDDVALLAVNPIDSIKSIVALRDQFNANPNTSISFPMLQDTCKLYLGFDVVAYPTTVFIDANGRILDIHIGTFPSEAAFFAAVEQYLY